MKHFYGEPSNGILWGRKNREQGGREWDRLTGEVLLLSKDKVVRLEGNLLVN